jgi:hypothetical protein
MFSIYISDVLFAKYNQNDYVIEDEIGRGCSTKGGEQKCI